MNCNIYFAAKNDGVVMTLFLSADSDAQYWQPVSIKMLTDPKILFIN